MAKQKHDLGLQKRRKQAPERERALARRRAKREAKSFSIGRYVPTPANYYGPPEHVRLAAYDLRRAGMHVTAQMVMEGRVEVTQHGTAVTPPPMPGPGRTHGSRGRSPEARQRRAGKVKEIMRRQVTGR